MYLERLRTLAQGSLEGFCMYCTRTMGVSAPSLHTCRDSTNSDNVTWPEEVGHGHVTQALRKLGAYLLWENVHALGPPFS